MKQDNLLNFTGSSIRRILKKVKDQTLSIRNEIFILINFYTCDYLNEREYDRKRFVGIQTHSLAVTYVLTLNLLIFSLFELVIILFNDMYCIFMLHISWRFPYNNKGTRNKTNKPKNIKLQFQILRVLSRYTLEHVIRRNMVY